MFALLGLTGMFGNQLLYILGVYYTNANIASIFQPAIPVWTALLAIITRIELFPPLKKARGWAKLLGILLAAAGAATMVVDKIKSGHGKLPKGYGLGYIFLIGNTLSMAVYILLQKKFIFNREESTWKTRPITVTAWSYLFGTIFMALASLYYVNKPEKFRHFPSEEVYPIIYAIFIASSLCYLLITWCNMQVSASVVTATWPLQVLFCAVLAYFVLGESLTVLEYVGAALIILGLFGVVWANYDEDKERREDEEPNYGYVRVANDDRGFVPESPSKTQKIN
jgi:drug/metabolite transporter (DMT)-like permease